MWKKREWDSSIYVVLSSPLVNNFEFDLDVTRWLCWQCSYWAEWPPIEVRLEVQSDVASEKKGYTFELTATGRELDEFDDVDDEENDEDDAEDADEDNKPSAILVDVSDVAKSG